MNDPVSAAAAAVAAAGETNALARELDAICASGPFRHSPQQQRLLRHLVARRNAGDLGSLREIALGVEMFRRSSVDFDPKKDPIVRVEARRLRERLIRYYALEGVSSAIEIVVPIGSYVPIVRARSPAARAATPSRAAPLLDRAWYLMRRRTIEGNRKALDLFTRAQLEDPECAAAFLGVAWVRVCIAGFEGVPAEAGSQREGVLLAIERARALDPAHPHVAVLAGVHAFRFEHSVAAAEACHRSAMMGAQADPILLGSSGWLFALTGRFAEAQRSFDAACAREPFGFWHRHNLASLAYLRRDYESAEKILRDALEIEPEHAVIRLLLARVLLCAQRGREAIAETAWCKTALPGMTGAELLHVAALAGAGDLMGAGRAMREFESNRGGRYASPVYRAIAQVALGDDDAAVESLGRAATDRDYWLPNASVDPVFDRLRSRADFAGILQSAGLPGVTGRLA